VLVVVVEVSCGGRGREDLGDLGDLGDNGDAEEVMELRRGSGIGVETDSIIVAC